jgi:hypothetical protein
VPEAVVRLEPSNITILDMGIYAQGWISNPVAEQQDAQTQKPAKYRVLNLRSHQLPCSADDEDDDDVVSWPRQSGDEDMSRSVGALCGRVM